MKENALLCGIWVEVCAVDRFIGKGYLGQRLGDAQGLTAGIQGAERNEVIQARDDIGFFGTLARSGAVVPKIPLVRLYGTQTNGCIELNRHALGIGRKDLGRELRTERAAQADRVVGGGRFATGIGGAQLDGKCAGVGVGVGRILGC